MALKVWQKTIASLGIIAAGTGSALAGVYFYANSKYGKGYGHHSSRSMNNNLNYLRDIKKYNLNFMDPINPNSVLAKYDYEKNEINHINADKWIFDYQKTHQKSPIFHVDTGSVLFQDYAPELVRPKDYVKFVAWFSKNISWGPDLSSLSFFRIIRGAIVDNGTVILGSYKVDNFATKRINFSPEAFFGMTSSKDFLKVFSEEGYTREELDKFIEYINKANANIKDKAAKMRIYSVEQRRGGLYYPTLANNSHAINKIAKYNPLLTTKVSNLDPVMDKNGVIKLVQRDSYKVKYASQMSNLQIWRGLAGKKWKGVDFEWLKYVTHHEYGHMQTMGMVNDSTNNPVALGTPNGSSLSKTGSAYDIDELNRYFAARLPHIRALRASIKLRNLKDENGEYIKGKYGWDFYQDRLKEWQAHPQKNEKPDPKNFTIVGFEILNADKKHWDKETIENIFGSTAVPANPNQAPLKVDVKDFLKRIKTGRRPRFFMQSIKDVRELAKKLNINQAALYVMNAIDPMIATISPGFTNEGNSLWNYYDKDKEKTNYKLEPTEVVELLKYFNKDGKFSSLYEYITTLKDSSGNLFLEKYNPKSPSHNLIYSLLAGKKGGVSQLFSMIFKDYVILPTKYIYKKNETPKKKKTKDSEERGPGYDWQMYKINPKAHDKNGKTLMSKIIDSETKAETLKPNENGLSFIALINDLVSNAFFHTIRGSELINGYYGVGQKGIKLPTISEIAKNGKIDENWKKWLKNPSDRNAGWLSQLFSDYTFQFPEVLTRDWVQITQNQTENSNFKYGSRFFDVNEKNTGIEMFFNTTSLLKQKIENVSYKDYFGGENLQKLYIDFPIKLLETIKLNIEKDEVSKTLYQKMTRTNKIDHLGTQALLFTPSEESQKLWEKWGIKVDGDNKWSKLKNKTPEEIKKIWKKIYGSFKEPLASFQGAKSGWDKTRMTSNGFFVDRWLRKVLGWELYDDNGMPKKYEGNETSFQDGQKIKTIPEAYWNFFMKSRGVGLRTLTKIWREPSRDAYAMWGYVPLAYKDKVKYLKFTNVDTHKQIYVPIQTGVDNLFYFKDKQARGKKHFLKEDGFISWTTNKFVSMGTWFDANVGNGKWKIAFVDANKDKVKILHNNKELTLLGNNKNLKDNKKQITTNNLSGQFAAVVIKKNANGEEIMTIKNEFPT